VDKWIQHQFDNPAREDGFKLSHWMKKDETNEIYPFSRFNRKVEIIKYTDEEYNKVLAPLSSDWTREETDHLLRLCERYSLRFIIIADRFEDSSEFEDSKGS